MSTFVRFAKIPARALRNAFSELRVEVGQLSTARKIQAFDKLQLGAGPNPLPGWGNVDLIGENLRWDLTRPLPLKSRSIKFVYSEHFIEHVTRDQAVMILTNCRKAMVSGGVIRLSTPDLKKLVSDYLEGHLIRMEHGEWYPKTLCGMVNEGVRDWGHQFIYDEPELRAVLEESGFTQIERVRWGESRHPELSGLETRPDFADLIVEAVAP